MDSCVYISAQTVQAVTNFFWGITGIMVAGALFMGRKWRAAYIIVGVFFLVASIAVTYHASLISVPADCSYIINP